MSTYRERREARADRLEEWAAKREAKAEAASERAHKMMDMIPLGQPILTDHYSAPRHRSHLAKVQSAASKSVEHAAKAHEMASKADNIRAAADRAVYSDDPDAIERLETKLAGLEARRDSIKAYNASAKKGSPDPSLLIAARDRDSVTLPHLKGFCCKPDGQMRVGVSNLSATINTTRKRLEALRAA